MGDMNTLPQYEMSLIKGDESDHSVELKGTDDSVAHYVCVPVNPLEKLLEFYQTEKRVQKAINSGLQNAQSMQSVYGYFPQEVKITPYDGDVDFIEMRTIDDRLDNDIPIIDGMWYKE